MQVKLIDSQIKSQEGLTLIEAMIAMMIMGFVLSSILAIVAHTARYLTDIRRTARSSQVLQQKMEDVRLLSWSNVQTLTNSFSDPDDPGLVYSGKISKSTFDSYGTTSTVTKVTLSATWRNQRGIILTNKLTTLISNGGLNKYIF